MSCVLAFSIETLINSLLGPLFAGAIGWGIATLLITPLVQVFKQRWETYEYLLLIYNISPPPRAMDPTSPVPPVDELKDWQAEWNSHKPKLREYAAKMEALYSVLPCWIKRFIKWDLKTAYCGLYGLSNTETQSERAIFEDDILLALKLPRRLTDRERKQFELNKNIL